MIKLLRFVKKRPDLTAEEFKRYWLTKHLELERWNVENTPMIKIEALFATGEMIGGKEPPFDGLAELCFENLEDMYSVMRSDVPARMLKDEENFVDTSAEVIRVVTEAYVVAEKGKPPVDFY